MDHTIVRNKGHPFLAYFLFCHIRCEKYISSRVFHQSRQLKNIKHKDMDKKNHNREMPASRAWADLEIVVSDCLFMGHVQVLHSWEKKEALNTWYKFVHAGNVIRNPFSTSYWKKASKDFEEGDSIAVIREIACYLHEALKLTIDYQDSPVVDVSIFEFIDAIFAEDVIRNADRDEICKGTLAVLNRISDVAECAVGELETRDQATKVREYVMDISKELARRYEIAHRSEFDSTNYAYLMTYAMRCIVTLVDDIEVANYNCWINATISEIRMHGVRYLRRDFHEMHEKNDYSMLHERRWMVPCMPSGDLADLRALASADVIKTEIILKQSILPKMFAMFACNYRKCVEMPSTLLHCQMKRMNPMFSLFHRAKKAIGFLVACKNHGINLDHLENAVTYNMSNGDPRVTRYDKFAQHILQEYGVDKETITHVLQDISEEKFFEPVMEKLQKVWEDVLAGR